MSGETIQPGNEVLERRKERTQTPKMFLVILLNDDYTTMEFVIEVLESLFQKSPTEAYGLTMKIHTQGNAVCGIYTYEVAKTKARSVRHLATREGFPLQVTVEEEQLKKN
jgi:ATP-dependent Clp protease adaptor protein ClpS